MAKPPPGRGPSPRDDARRRGWDEPQPRGRKAGGQRQGWRDEPEDAPWLDEADYEDEGPTHTLVGRKTLFALLFGLGVLVVGVIVGIGLVSRRDEAPIDVPAVGEEIPVLANPGPWKLPPSGPDVDGTPVEGQGQVLFGTGEGRETEAMIATDAMPEDPLPRPGLESETEAVIAEAPAATPASQPAPAARPAPSPSDTAPPREPVKPAAARPVTPKVIEAPAVAPRAAAPAGGGSLLQLGAFSSESRARAAFKSLSERYSYLAGLEPVILPVASDGKTLYRLRSSAGSDAAARDICGRLRVAGEACTVVN
jgi:cell division septation protein DedD